MDLPTNIVVQLATVKDAYEKLRASCAIHMARYSEADELIFLNPSLAAHQPKRPTKRSSSSSSKAQRSGKDSPRRGLLFGPSFIPDDAALVSTVDVGDTYEPTPFETMTCESLVMLKRLASRESLQDLAIGRTHRISSIAQGKELRFAIAAVKDGVLRPRPPSSQSLQTGGNRSAASTSDDFRRQPGGVGDDDDDELERFIVAHDLDDEIQYFAEPSRLVQAKYLMQQQGTMMIKRSVFVYCLSRSLWRMQASSSGGGSSKGRRSKLSILDAAILLTGCRRISEKIFVDMDNDAVGMASWGDFTNSLLALADHLAHSAAVAEEENTLSMTLSAVQKGKEQQAGKGSSAKTIDVAQGYFHPAPLPNVSIPGGRPVELIGGQLLAVENSRLIIFEAADRYFLCLVDDPATARYFFMKDFASSPVAGQRGGVDPPPAAPSTVTNRAVGSSGDGGRSATGSVANASASSGCELLSAFMCRSDGIHSTLFVFDSEFRLRVFDVPIAASLKPLVERGRVPTTFDVSVTATCCFFAATAAAITSHGSVTSSGGGGGSDSGNNSPALTQDEPNSNSDGLLEGAGHLSASGMPKHVCMIGDRQGTVRMFNIDAFLLTLRRHEVQQQSPSLTLTRPEQQQQLIASVTVRKRQIHREGFHVTCLAILGTSQVVSSGLDGCVHILDAISLAKVHTIRAHETGVRHIACSASLQIIVTQGFDRSTSVWGSSRSTHRIELHDGARPHMHNILRVYVVEALRQIVSCDASGFVKVWDVSTSTCQSNFSVGPYSSSDAASKVSDGIGGGGDGSLQQHSSGKPSSGSESSGNGDGRLGSMGHLQLATGSRNQSDGVVRVHMDRCTTVRHLSFDPVKCCFFVSGTHFRMSAAFISESSLQRAHTETLRGLVSTVGVGMIFSAAPAEIRAWDCRSLSFIRVIAIDTAPSTKRTAAKATDSSSKTDRTRVVASPTSSSLTGATVVEEEVLVRCVCTDVQQSKLFVARSDGSVLVFRTNGDREIKRFTARHVFVPGIPGVGAALDVVFVGYIETPRKEIVTVATDGVFRFFPDVGPSRVIARYLFFDDFAKFEPSLTTTGHNLLPRSGESFSDMNASSSPPAGRGLRRADSRVKSASIRRQSAASSMTGGGIISSGLRRRRSTVSSIFAQVLGESDTRSPTEPSSPNSPSRAAAAAQAGADPVRLVAFSPLTNLVACIHASGKIVVTDTTSITGFPLHVFDVAGDATSLCFLGGYPCLVVGDSSGRLHFYLLQGSTMLEVYNKFLKQFSPTHLVGGSLHRSREAVSVVDVLSSPRQQKAMPGEAKDGVNPASVAAICVVVYDAVSGALLVSLSDGTVKSLTIDDLIVSLDLRPVGSSSSVARSSSSGSSRLASPLIGDGDGQIETIRPGEGIDLSGGDGDDNDDAEMDHILSDAMTLFIGGGTSLGELGTAESLGPARKSSLGRRKTSVFFNEDEDEDEIDQLDRKNESSDATYVKKKSNAKENGGSSSKPPRLVMKDLSLQEILLGGGLIHFARRSASAAGASSCSPTRRSSVTSRAVLSREQIEEIQIQLGHHCAEARSNMRSPRRYSFYQLREAHEEARRSNSVSNDDEKSNKRASTSPMNKDRADHHHHNNTNTNKSDDTFLLSAEQEFVESAERADLAPTFRAVGRWVRVVFSHQSTCPICSSRELFAPLELPNQFSTRVERHRQGDNDEDRRRLLSTTISLVTHISIVRNGFPVTADVDGAVFLWKPYFQHKIVSVSSSLSVPRHLSQLSRGLKDSYSRVTLHIERERQLREAMQSSTNTSGGVGGLHMSENRASHHLLDEDDVFWYSTDRELAELSFSTRDVYRSIELGVNRLLRDLGKASYLHLSSSTRSADDDGASAPVSEEKDNTQIADMDFYQRGHIDALKRFAASRAEESRMAAVQKIRQTANARTRESSTTSDRWTNEATDAWSGFFEPKKEEGAATTGNEADHQQGQADARGEQKIDAESDRRQEDGNERMVISPSMQEQQQQALSTDFSLADMTQAISLVIEHSISAPGSALTARNLPQPPGPRHRLPIATIASPGVSPSVTCLTPSLLAKSNSSTSQQYHYIAPKGQAPKFSMPTGIGMAELYRSVMHPVVASHEAEQQRSSQNFAPRPPFQASSVERNGSPNRSRHLQDGSDGLVMGSPPSAARKAKVGSSPHRRSTVPEALRHGRLPELSETDLELELMEQASKVIHTRQLAFQSQSASSSAATAVANRIGPPSMATSGASAKLKPPAPVQSLTEFLATVGGESVAEPSRVRSDQRASAAPAPQKLPGSAAAVVVPTSAVSLPFGLLLPSGAAIKTTVRGANK